MNKAKWLLERIFVFAIMSMMIALGVFNWFFGANPSKAAIVSIVMLIGFTLSIIFALLFKLAVKKKQ